MTMSPQCQVRAASLPAAELLRLPAAARDCRYLLARGYPRPATLTLVGNRYQLSEAVRQILHRGVFAPLVARRRRQKCVALASLAGQPLAVDGHNVVITLECAWRGIPVLAADDGFIRDIGRLSRAYRPGPVTAAVLHHCGRYLAAAGVGVVTVWYDAPMSRSGELAALTTKVLDAWGLQGQAQAVPVPERQLLAAGQVIASSDTYLIDHSRQVADVAGEIIRQWPAIRVISLSFVGK